MLGWTDGLPLKWLRVVPKLGIRFFGEHKAATRLAKRASLLRVPETLILHSTIVFKSQSGLLKPVSPLTAQLGTFVNFFQIIIKDALPWVAWSRTLCDDGKVRKERGRKKAQQPPGIEPSNSRPWCECFNDALQPKPNSFNCRHCTFRWSRWSLIRHCSSWEACRWLRRRFL